MCSVLKRSDCFPLDVDECEKGLAQCDTNAYCSNTIGTFFCTCNANLFRLCKQAEEQRQAVIDKQNSKLLQRIVDIMTSKKKTFPVANSHETKRKVRKM